MSVSMKTIESVTVHVKIMLLINAQQKIDYIRLHENPSSATFLPKKAVKRRNEYNFHESVAKNLKICMYVHISELKDIFSTADHCVRN